MWRPYHRSAAANPPQTPERQQHVLCNRPLMSGSPAGMESLFVPDLASLHHAARVMGRKSRPIGDPGCGGPNIDAGFDSSGVTVSIVCLLLRLSP